MRLAIIIWLCCVSAQAAVINANSTSWVDASNALFSASDWDTIQFPSSSSNAWAGELLVRKTGITFSGSGTTNSTTSSWITYAGSDIQGYCFNAQSNSVTFTNITFSGTNAGRVSGGFWGRAIHLAGPYGRATRCAFKFFDTAVIHEYPGTVVYKCMFLDNRIFGRCFGAGDGSANWTAYGPAGTLNYATTNFSFFEDNIVDQSPSMPGDASVAWSGQQGQVWQVRNNQFTFRSSWDYSPVFDFHGPTDPGLRGGIGMALGSNYFDFSGTGATFDRLVDLRGGSALVYSNMVVGQSDSRAIFMRVANQDTLAMYFENGGIEQVTNAWFWNNTQQGSPFTIDTEVDGGSDSGGDDRVYIVPGASWSNAIPSFAFLAPYPMPLRDDATPTVVTVVNGVRKLKGIKLNR